MYSVNTDHLADDYRKDYVIIWARFDYAAVERMLDIRPHELQEAINQFLSVDGFTDAPVYASLEGILADVFSFDFETLRNARRLSEIPAPDYFAAISDQVYSDYDLSEFDDEFYLNPNVPCQASMDRLAALSLDLFYAFSIGLRDMDPEAADYMCERIDQDSVLWGVELQEELISFSIYTGDDTHEDNHVARTLHTLCTTTVAERLSNIIPTVKSNAFRTRRSGVYRTETNSEKTFGGYRYNLGGLGI